MKNTNTMVLIIVGALVIGAAGFFVGRHTSVRFGRQWTMAGNPQGNVRLGFGKGGMMRGKSANLHTGRSMMRGAGEITKIDGNKVTLKIDEETTKEITLSEDAVVNTMTKGTTKDLKVGQTIMITGGGFWNGTETVIVRP